MENSSSVSFLLRLGEDLEVVDFVTSSFSSIKSSSSSSLITFTESQISGAGVASSLGDVIILKLNRL